MWTVYKDLHQEDTFEEIESIDFRCEIGHESKISFHHFMALIVGSM